jgi:hypothetical protein
MMVPFEIVGVKKSDILAYWKPSSELWAGDWYNRMDRYYAEGRFQAGPATPGTKKDSAQLNLFDDDEQLPKQATTSRNFSNLKNSLLQRQGAIA